MRDDDFLPNREKTNAEDPEHREDPVRIALREALKEVLGRIPEEITVSNAVEFFESEDLTPGKRWTAEDIDFEYLMDAAVEINGQNIARHAVTHMRDYSEIRPESARDLVDAVSKCVRNMSENAYLTADIVAKRGWKEDGSRSRFAKSAQDVAMLIELLGGDTESSILIKEMYAHLLFQAFNGRESWNNILIQTGESRVNRQMSEEDVLNQVEFQMNNGFMEAVGAKRAVLRALSEVPYVFDAGFASAEDEVNGSHITFRIDPRKYGEVSKISKFPAGFYDFFGSSRNEIEVDSYGIPDEPVPGGVAVSHMRYKETGNELVFFRDGIYKAVVRVYFDASLEKVIDCRLGSGSISFSQIDFDRVPPSEPNAYSKIPDAIIRRYIGFRKNY